MHNMKDCTNSEKQVLKVQINRNIRTYRATIIRGKKMKQVQPTRLMLGHVNHGNRPKDSNSVGIQQFHDPMSIHKFNSNMGGQDHYITHENQGSLKDIVPEIETLNDDVHSESDKDYDPTNENDINDDDHANEDDDTLVRYEQLADDALPINDIVIAVNAPTTTVTSKKRKGRGPTKNLKVTDPMHLEYNALGQPCGKWRRQYGKQVGLSVRKISILHAWNEVPESLKNSLWDNAMNLFHIEHDEEKKSIFLSAVAERFRDFKSKLVARWITKKSHRQTKKVKRGNKGGEEAPSKMPYEIWPNISKNEWEAFVAKKTTLNEVEKRGKASESAKKRKFYHHMGPRTYDEARKEWVDAGLYPNQSPAPNSCTTTSASLNTPAGDRVRDWYCGLHARDESGKFTIPDPRTKKIADAVMGWKEKEATGEFTPRGNVDALHMVLGKDHQGRVVGKGGVRVGVRKAFGKECVTTQSKTMSSLDKVEKRLKKKITADVTANVRAQVTKDVLDKVASLLQKMGAPSVDLANMIVEDQQSQRRDPKASVEPSPEPVTPVAHQPIHTRSTPEPHNPTPRP